MTNEEIGALLENVCAQLTTEVRMNPTHWNAKMFERRVRDVLEMKLDAHGKSLLDFADQDFPDIVVGDWGVEVKLTKDDKWRTVANSVFEGHRRADVGRVFLVYAKLGGLAEVRWKDYGSCVVHVRTSHRPRYEVDLEAKKSLFDSMGVSYDDFREMPESEKMAHIRSYARGRLKAGEQLWWLGEDPENPHSLPLEVRLYRTLTNAEKRRFRAEVTFLFPEVLKGGRVRNKYSRAALHLLTYRGVLASQARDMFSAGSVAGTKRGGNYLARAFENLMPDFMEAVRTLDSGLLEEYWGKKPADVAERLMHWRTEADSSAKGWKPSAIVDAYLKSPAATAAGSAVTKKRSVKKTTQANS
jgi:hypothetical protein